VRIYGVISGKFDRITKCTMVVEITKIVMFRIFASPRKEVDAFGKKVKLADALRSSQNSRIEESLKLSETALVPPTGNSTSVTNRKQH
jgi:hypothetical protein